MRINPIQPQQPAFQSKIKLSGHSVEKFYNARMRKESDTYTLGDGRTLEVCRMYDLWDPKVLYLKYQKLVDSAGNFLRSRLITLRDGKITREMIKP